jgi:hypothetical protein
MTSVDVIDIIQCQYPSEDFNLSRQARSGFRWYCPVSPVLNPPRRCLRQMSAGGVNAPLRSAPHTPPTVGVWRKPVRMGGPKRPRSSEFENWFYEDVVADPPSLKRPPNDCKASGERYRHRAGARVRRGLQRLSGQHGARQLCVATHNCNHESNDSTGGRFCASHKATPSLG